MKRAIVLLAAVAVFLFAAAALSAAVFRGIPSSPRTSSPGSTAALPDVCRTPSPGSAVPIPYVNQGGSPAAAKDAPSKSAPKASSRGNRNR